MTISIGGAPAAEFFDRMTVIVGLPRHGKTTIARDEASGLLREFPTSIVLAHDPNAQFRDFCAVYDTVDEYRAKRDAATAKRLPFPRGASIRNDAKAVRDEAIRIGRDRNIDVNVRVPVKLSYDEGSLAKSSGGSWMNEVDEALLSNRAHWGIWVTYNIQKPTALTEAFYTMARDVYVFSMPSRRRTAVLEDYLGLKEGALDELVGAPKFKYKHWRSGVGLL